METRSGRGHDPQNRGQPQASRKGRVMKTQWRTLHAATNTVTSAEPLGFDINRVWRRQSHAAMLPYRARIGGRKARQRGSDAKMLPEHGATALASGIWHECSTCDLFQTCVLSSYSI